jgi:hypothetical protein
MRNKFRLAAIFVVATGCGAYDDFYVPEPSYEEEKTPVPPVKERLEDRADLHLVLNRSEVGLHATRSYPTEIAEDMELAVVGGNLSLERTDDDLLRVEKLEVVVEDIVFVDDAGPPEGLHLAGVRITLARPVETEAEWLSDGCTAWVEMEADLFVHWSLVLDDGKILNLAPRRLNHVPVNLAVATDAEGDLRARLGAAYVGEFFSLAGIYALSHLTIDMRAGEVAIK